MQIVVRTAAMIAAFAVAACGGSSDPSTHSSASSASRPGTGSASGVGSGSPSGTPADAATLSAIDHAFATFFGSTSTAAQSQAALQNGDRFTATLKAQGSSSYADKSSGSVNSARLVSPDVAAVTFTISSGGSVLLKAAPGYAVRTAGRWQVAARTFCELLKLESDAPAACDDSSVTALPH